MTLGTTTIRDIEKITLRLADGVLYQQLDGEAVLLNTRSGQYFGLNEVGARIWDGVTAGKSMAEVLEQIRTEYDVPAERLFADILKFLESLEQSRLIRIERIQSQA
ncbi:MAG: PqqD family protein [Chloroflexi bacterium]|nr:PqqD family protein [Chloroflexota bacterium]